MFAVKDMFWASEGSAWSDGFFLSLSSLPCFFFFSFPFFNFLATLLGLRDLSSPTRDGTRARALKAPSPNHWTAREFPFYFIFYFILFIKNFCFLPSFLFFFQTHIQDLLCFCRTENTYSQMQALIHPQPCPGKGAELGLGRGV